jgi:hypothetical protein
MTGREPSRPRPGGLLSSGGPAGPGRPLLTTPPHLQPKALADLQRQHLAAQPWLGVGGLLLAAVVFFALALGTGSTETSLLILGPMSTFALPAVAMIAFWWNDWPGSKLTTPWAGLIDTVLVVAASVVLTIAGQAIVERSDVRAVFEANPGPGVPATFPVTLALAGAAFTAMLQLSLVCERWPLGRIGRLRSGLAALALSWAAGIGAYLPVRQPRRRTSRRARRGRAAQPRRRHLRTRLRRGAHRRRPLAGGVLHRPARLARQHDHPPPASPARRQRPHTRPRRTDLPSAPQPGPLAASRHQRGLRMCHQRRAHRGHAVRRLARRTAPPAPGRVLTLALTALVALALNRALTAYADGVHWTKATPDDWITTTALSFIGAGIILHVGIGLRWPFALKTKENP